MLPIPCPGTTEYGNPSLKDELRGRTFALRIKKMIPVQSNAQVDSDVAVKKRGKKLFRLSPEDFAESNLGRTAHFSS